MANVKITLPNGKTEVLPEEIWRDLWKKTKQENPFSAEASDDVERVVASVTWARMKPRALSKLARLGWEGEKMYISLAGHVLLIDDLAIQIFPSLDAVNQFFESRAY